MNFKNLTATLGLIFVAFTVNAQFFKKTHYSTYHDQFNEFDNIETYYTINDTGVDYVFYEKYYSPKKHNGFKINYNQLNQLNNILSKFTNEYTSYNIIAEKNNIRKMVKTIDSMEVICTYDTGNKTLCDTCKMYFNYGISNRGTDSKPDMIYSLAIVVVPKELPVMVISFDDATAVNYFKYKCVYPEFIKNYSIQMRQDKKLFK